MATVEYLYAVVWRPIGWVAVKDEMADRTVPAVYVYKQEAEVRAKTMRESFDDCEYQVVTLEIAALAEVQA